MKSDYNLWDQYDENFVVFWKDASHRWYDTESKIIRFFLNGMGNMNQNMHSAPKIEIISHIEE